MSLRPDGTYRCDRCGVDVGNAAVTECAIVSDLEAVDDAEVAFRPRLLHFCRRPNPGAPDGCAAHLLLPSNLADYYVAKETDA